ncbi:MAG: type II toxin-antitoxin system VapC family toxin [Bryobacteraceae bacterium]
MRIVVDASALLAVLLGEPDADDYLSKLLTADQAWISPVNWWEVQVRMRSRHGEAGELKSAAWMKDLGLVVEPTTLEQARFALAAFARYQGRPARLNLGDCFAYALAQVKDAPLLFKGDDFKRTDIRSVG